MRRLCLLILVVFSASFPRPPYAVADEGMWPYQQVPVDAIEKKYGFRPSQDWLDRVQQSSVRLQSGCSASFVSADGLVMTNHHCVLGCLKALSEELKKNLVQEGFTTQGRDQERRCPGMAADVLLSMMDVTQRLAQAKNPEAEKERLRKEAGAGEGKSIEFVSLHGGQETWRYHYQTYDDVRLVMAPEMSVAQFGGDQDNFDFPRHNLDMGFLRIYRDGKPVSPKHHLTWSPGGAKKGELTFVSGHPGGTERFLSLAQAKFTRDHWVPAIIARLEANRQALLAASGQDPKQAPPAVQVQLFHLENSLKAIRGWKNGLNNPASWAKKQRQEEELRTRIKADPDLKRKFEPVFSDLERIDRSKAERFTQYFYRQGGSSLYSLATSLQNAAEKLKTLKEEEREAFRQSTLKSLEAQAKASFAVPGLQEKLLAASLSLSRKMLGDEDPYVKEVLGGKSPEQVARQAVGTRLNDPEFRKSLLAGDGSVVASSNDPFLALARTVERHAAPMRQWYDKAIAPREEKAAKLLAETWRAAYGKSLYPDANFTLRLSYGQVQGYESFDKKVRPYKSTFYGLFEKNESYDNEAPYDLPERVRRCRQGLDLCTPLNIVTNNDVIGGNSGSPLINRQGQVVGLVFDMNLEGLGNRFIVGDNDRTIAVDSRAILHALRRIYRMDKLAEEIAGKTAAQLLGKDPKGDHLQPEAGKES